jgi:hypothetical protein
MNRMLIINARFERAARLQFARSLRHDTQASGQATIQCFHTPTAEEFYDGRMARLFPLSRFPFRTTQRSCSKAARGQHDR